MAVLDGAINSTCTQQYTYMSCDPFMNNDLDESGSSEKDEVLRSTALTTSPMGFRLLISPRHRFCAYSLKCLTLRLFSLACAFPTDPRLLALQANGFQALKSGLLVLGLHSTMMDTEGSTAPTKGTPSCKASTRGKEFLNQAMAERGEYSRK